MIDIGGGFKVVTRAEWGARPAQCAVPTVAWSQRVGVAYHIQAGNRDTGPEGFQNYAMDSLGYCDSHYNFMVNSDLADQWGGAYIFELRGATKQAAHSSGENTAWIGVVTAGRNDDVTAEDLAALSAVHAWLERLGGKQLQHLGHQQLPGAQTSCPGTTIMEWLNLGGPDIGADMTTPAQNAGAVWNTEYNDTSLTPPVKVTTATQLLRSYINTKQILAELAVIRQRLDMLETGGGSADVDAVADELAAREAAAARAAAETFEESI